MKSFYKYLIEVVVIVFSILAAFGLEAWWEEREEDIERRLMYRSLLADLNADRQMMQNLMSYLKSADSAYTIILSKKNLSEEEVAKSWYYGTDHITAQYAQTSFELYKSSGRIEILNPSIVKEIQGLYVSYERWGVFIDQYLDIVHNQLRPILFEIGYTEESMSEMNISYLHRPLPNSEYARKVIKDMRYKRGIVYQKILAVNIVSSYTRGLDLIGTIVTTLEGELK